MSKTATAFRSAFDSGVNAALAIVLVILVASVSWVPHLPESLWLDETLTFWVSKDGFVETIDRSVTYQSQLLYYVWMWCWCQVFGTSEVALRIPSLLAAIGALIASVRVGTLLTKDRETGYLCMIVLASTFNFFRESVDARPYTMGLLVLCVLVLCLIRWLDTGDWRYSLGVGLSGAALPHLHVFFVLTYPAFLSYGALRYRECRPGVAQIATIALLLLAGALAFVPAALTITENAGSYSFIAPPEWRSLFLVFVWGPAVAGLLAGAVIAGVWPGRSSDEALRPSRTLRNESILLAGWVLGPLLLLFFVSMFTEYSIFLGRYLIPTIPAVALLYAISIRRIDSAPARVIAAVIVALASLATHVRPPDDFRGAAVAVNEFVSRDSTVPVLLASGLIEGQSEHRLRDPTYVDYLNAPTAYYPVEGSVVAIPRILEGHPSSNEIVAPILESGRPFVAIEWYGNGARALGWLRQRAMRSGYTPQLRGFGGVRVAFFRFTGRARNPASDGDGGTG